MAKQKLVPNKSGGASRRAYHGAHAKSASQKTSDMLGGTKLRTPNLAPPKIDTGTTAPSRSKGRTDYRKITEGEEFSPDYGDTGFTKEDWNV